MSVHGYTYRQVCANGAIAAVPGEQFCIERAGPWSPIELVTPILDATRDALRQCAASPLFDRTVAQMRRATQADPSQALRVLPALMYAMSAHAPVGWRDRVMHEVTRRWLADRDRSLFGVLNAVTATARDEPNPALKWELESVGGMLLQGAMLPRRAHADRPTRTIAAAPSEVGELVEVGR